MLNLLIAATTLLSDSGGGTGLNTGPSPKPLTRGGGIWTVFGAKLTTFLCVTAADGLGKGRLPGVSSDPPLPFDCPLPLP